MVSRLDYPPEQALPRRRGVARCTVPQLVFTLKPIAWQVVHCPRSRESRQDIPRRK
jgi:hypothetical protein